MRSNRSAIVDRPSSIVLITLFFIVVSGFLDRRSFSGGGGRTLTAQQYSFEQVAAGLKHTDPETRIRAIQILKDADYQEAAGPIGVALGDTDDRVQLAAIDAERSLFTLRPVSRKSRVGFVIERRTTVGGDSATEGQLALKARRVPYEVLAGLVLALSDPNPRVRGEAVFLATQLAPVACPHLVRVSGEPRRAFDSRTDQLCAQVGNVLIENINSREATLRRSAIFALGRLRYPNAVQALSDQLSYHQKGADAAAAFEALALIGHDASVSTFGDSLASSNATVRRLAVDGLARARHSESLAAFQQLGQTERSAAVLLALHYANLRLGSPGDSLAQLVASTLTASLRMQAIQYLLDLAPVSAKALTEWLRDERADVRRTIADVLGFSYDRSILPQLGAASQDPDPDVAAAAGRAAERIKLTE
jgi:HEAT repeat protein